MMQRNKFASIFLACKGIRDQYCLFYVALKSIKAIPAGMKVQQKECKTLRSRLVLELILLFYGKRNSIRQI